MSLLPTSLNKPDSDIKNLVTLLYGAPKVGKSTFCSKVPGAVFLATEPGLRALSVHSVDIPDWRTFLMVAGELKGSDHQFKTIIIDTVSNLYPLCAEFICAKHGVDYAGDMPFGKGFSLIHSEFNRAITKLAQLPYGLIMIGHDIQVELTTRTGISFNKITLSLPERARRTLLAMADLILFTEVQETKERGYERIIRTKPTMLFDAGDRTGRLPESYPLDYAETVKHLNRASSPREGK